ncbi:MAG: 5-deoxy-glucuronate isomerase [Yonghaparkia sp.]|nr:5-deoxy-glucuronate isomerase [Microcella sp.]
MTTSKSPSHLLAHDQEGWFFPAGSLREGTWATVVDRTQPGWSHTGMRVADLAGIPFALMVDAVERVIVPLSGTFTVEYQLEGEHLPVEQVLVGRASVFDGPTDVLYLPVGTSAAIRGTGRIAVAEAPATAWHPARYIPHADVPVELRGAGRATRQVHNFGVPGILDADRLIVCEVITPADNWSSYPPHKHDEHIEGSESALEEIYYFETAVTRGAPAGVEGADPIGYVRTYASGAGEIDTLAEVRSGDVALVPHGWHGPCMAAPGYDLYYLNVMAGPGAERAWLITDDPAHAWVRATWADQAPDARLPYLAPATAGRPEDTHS